MIVVREKNTVATSPMKPYVTTINGAHSTDSHTGYNESINAVEKTTSRATSPMDQQVLTRLLGYSYSEFDSDFHDEQRKVDSWTSPIQIPPYEPPGPSPIKKQEISDNSNPYLNKLNGKVEDVLRDIMLTTSSTKNPHMVEVLSTPIPPSSSVRIQQLPPPPPAQAASKKTVDTARAIAVRFSIFCFFITAIYNS